MNNPLKMCVAAFGLLLPTLAASAPAPRDPSGAWLTEDGRARIKVEKCGQTSENICGFVIWLKTPNDAYGHPRLDTKNPDPDKTERPLLGHQLIMGLRPNSDGRYEGKIYNSEDGKKYDVNVWLDQPNELKVKGCLIAFLCSTQTWIRTTDALPGQLVAATGTPGGPQPDPEWASAKAAGGTAASSRPASPRRDPKPKS